MALGMSRIAAPHRSLSSPLRKQWIRLRSRTRQKQGSTDPADQEVKTFRMELAGKNKGVFKNAADREDLLLLTDN
jgi:hypothetical protein